MRGNEPQQWMYFPLPGTVASVLRTARSGATIEICGVGAEGMVGAEGIMSTALSGSDALVQIGGEMARVSIAEIRRSLADTDTRNVLRSCIGALLRQIEQNVLCNGLHTARQRLAKWLLFAADRAGTEQLRLTHDSLSQVLGVRRAGITLLVGALTDDDMIHRARGRITITDRRQLERTACECYAIGKR